MTRRSSFNTKPKLDKLDLEALKSMDPVVRKGAVDRLRKQGWVDNRLPGDVYTTRFLPESVSKNSPSDNKVFWNGNLEAIVVTNGRPTHTLAQVRLNSQSGRVTAIVTKATDKELLAVHKKLQQIARILGFDVEEVHTAHARY